MIKDIKCPVPWCGEKFPIRIEDRPIKIVCRNIDCGQELLISFVPESGEILIEAIPNIIRNVRCPICKVWFPVRLNEKHGGSQVFCKNIKCYRIMWIPIYPKHEIIVEPVPHFKW